MILPANLGHNTCIQEETHERLARDNLDGLRIASLKNVAQYHGALHPVDKPGPLTNQRLVLAVRPFAILLLKGRDRRHAAMVDFAAQPAEKGTLEQPGAAPICLGPPVLSRDCHTR